MDFKDLLSMAAYNEKSAKKEFTSSAQISTNLSTPKRERKSNEVTSETLKKLREEKAREREAQEQERKRIQKEEEKKKIFRIPKSGNKGDRQSKSADEEKRKSDKNDVKKEKRDQKAPSSDQRQVKQRDKVKRESSGVVEKVKKEIKIDQKPSILETSPTKSEYNYTKDVEQMQYTFKGPRTAQPAMSAAWAKMEAQIQRERQEAMRKKVADINRKIQEDLDREKDAKARKEQELAEYERRKKEKEKKKLSKEFTAKEFKSSKEKDKDRNRYEKNHSSQASLPPVKVEAPKPKPKPVIKKKPRPTGAPLDFTSILKMAEKKQVNTADDKTPAVPIIKKKKEERPMTQEEKDRAARKKTKEYQDWIKYGHQRPKQPSVSSDSESFSDISDDEVPPPAKHSSHSKSFSAFSFNKPSSNVKLSNSFSGSKSSSKLSNSDSRHSSSSHHRTPTSSLKSQDTRERELLKQKLSSKSASSSMSSKFHPDRHKNNSPKPDHRNHNKLQQTSHKSDKHSSQLRDNHKHSDKHVSKLKDHHNHGNSPRQSNSKEYPQQSRPQDSYKQKSVDKHKSLMSQSKQKNSSHDATHVRSRDLQNGRDRNDKHKNSNHLSQEKQRHHHAQHEHHKSSPLQTRDNKYQDQDARNKHKDSVQSASRDGHRGQQKLVSKERRDRLEERGGKKSRREYDDEHENVLVCGPASPSSPSPPSSPVPSNPFDRIVGQIKKNNQKMQSNKRKRQIIDSDSEEDADMADFIDDGDDEDLDDPSSLDYSKYIRQIFGYDKRKFAHMREDDADCMESNYSTVMREEARSAKLGLLEDLEDMRMEEEELRRKKMKAKRGGRK